MKAIITKYLGPTNTRGSRIKASDDDHNSVTVGVDYSLNDSENHARACARLCDKMGWRGELVSGHIRNGMVWVFSRGAVFMKAEG